MAAKAIGTAVVISRGDSKINGRCFDLVACSGRHELCAVNSLPYVRSESDPRGSIFGFKVETPFRVWYTPAGVIVRADVEVPDAYRDPARRGEFLKEKWETKRGTGLSDSARKRIGERLANADELAEQARRSLSTEAAFEWEERIRKLQAKLGNLGGRRPSK